MNDNTPSELAMQSRAMRSTIGVVSTFVADPVQDVLSYWFRHFNYQADILPIQYGQVIQRLVTTGSTRNNIDIHVVMFSIRDFIPVKDRQSLVDGRIHVNVEQFIETLQGAMDASAGAWIVVRCPDPPQDATDINAAFDKQAAYVLSVMNNLSRAAYIDATRAGDIYVTKSCFDEVTDRHAHIPYTDDYYTVLGTLIFRAIRAYQSKPYKLIVTDCDDTLWEGVCGEDGTAGINILPHHQWLHQFLRQQSSAGTLLALCSQNDINDVQNIFEQRNDLGLSLTDITSTRINWEDKADNIKDLARELNIAEDSIVFLDNDPLQRSKVKAKMPGVLVPDLPSDSREWSAYLQHIWAFDDYWITAEASKRQNYYKQHLDREDNRARTGSMADFIAQLQLNVTIKPAAKNDVARVFELLQRVTQFNLNGKHFSEKEILNQLSDERHQWLIVHADDRYGDYGLVGAVSSHYVHDECHIDTFLLSCRALLRGIEVKMLQAVCERALDKHINQMRFNVTRTDRNTPMLAFLKRLGMSDTDLDAGTFEISPDRALTLLDQLAEPEIISNNNDKKSVNPVVEKYSPARSVISSEADCLLAAAITSLNIEQLTNTLKAGDERKSGSNDEALIVPGTETENTMLGIFQELLGHKDININDEFFDAGGHSILVMRLLSRITTVFGVDLPIRTLFIENLTIANLAAIVDSAKTPEDTHAELDAIKNTLDSFSDNELSELFGDLGLDKSSK